MIIAPKGTKDVLPEEVYKWQYIEETARKTADIFGATEIRTPTFEHTEVFARGVGEDTDVVNKEMYTFLDKGDRSITLKPEGTAGVARAFIENGLANSPMPLKVFYITPCFRYERPQAGRMREFHQFGLEFLGSDKPTADAETIIFAQHLLSRLGISGLSLRINSIGCKECRKEYYRALKNYLEEKKDDLCDLCRNRMERNPLRVLDCKNQKCKEIAASAPSILDYLCDDCKTHFEEVKKLLTSAGIKFSVDDKIVRGLDYYTKTVFEFVSENIGAQGTVCGGGRYDALISGLGGNDTQGVGFAIGIERLLLLAEVSGVNFPKPKTTKVYVAPIGEEEKVTAFSIVYTLRENGVKCDLDHLGRGIKAQFKYADKIAAEYVAVIGSEEAAKKVLKVKKMQSGEEFFLPIDEAVKFFTEN